MPRVYDKKKNRGGKTATYRCHACADPIEPGQRYYEWSFRYGGTYRRHTSHGYPPPSMLTQSKLSAVYAAQETLQMFQPGEREPSMGDDDYFTSVRDDADNALSEAASEAEGVAGEYQDAIDAMPASEAENQERIDALEEWQSALEDAQSDIASMELGDYDDLETAIGEVTGRLDQAAGELSV